MEALIQCREDLYDYFLSCGLPDERAHYYMEIARKGRFHSGYCPVGWADDLRKYGVAQWCISFMEETEYLPERNPMGRRQKFLQQMLATDPSELPIYLMQYCPDSEDFLLPNLHPTVHYESEKLVKKVKAYLRYQPKSGAGYAKTGIDRFITRRLRKQYYPLNHDILLLEHPGARLYIGTPSVYAVVENFGADEIVRISIDENAPVIFDADCTLDIQENFLLDLSFIRAHYQALMIFWLDDYALLTGKDKLRLLREPWKQPNVP